VELADGLAQVVERAVLSRRLREQRREVQRIATWADVRTGELSNGAISLSIDDAEGAAEASRSPDGLDEDGVIKLLTARELDVLALMADGKTNPEIAATLFVSAGTIKFHVKNILRKLQAANRADATSRYLKLTLTRGDGRNPTHR
jgi:DNA-binding NarL/FixJ family response regulator